MAKVEFDKKSSLVDENKRDVNDRTCCAHGCPRIATLFFDGRWICRYHDNKPPEDWPIITNWLKDNERQINSEESEKGYIFVGKQL